MNNRGIEPWAQAGRRADMFDLKPGKRNLNITHGFHQLSARGGARSPGGRLRLPPIYNMRNPRGFANLPDGVICRFTADCSGNSDNDDCNEWSDHPLTNFDLRPGFRPLPREP